jgi:hypothetical protein
MISFGPILSGREVLKVLMTTLNLNHFAGWSLYSTGAGKALKSTDFVMNVINSGQLD